MVKIRRNKLLVAGVGTALVCVILMSWPTNVAESTPVSQAKRDSSKYLTGYRVVDAQDSKAEEPRNCGPFLHWNLDRFRDGKIPYYISSKGSKDLTLDQVKTTVEKAFASWRAIEGVALDFKFMGFLDPCFYGKCNQKNQFSVGDHVDGKNVIYFDEIGTFFPPNTEEPLGFTRIARDSTTGEITEADILLNGTFVPPVMSRARPNCADRLFKTPIKWSLTEFGCVRGVYSTGEYRVHLQSVLTHEIGHFLGLGHSLAEGATMHDGGTGDNTDASTLDVDDKNGARFLYPSEMRFPAAPVQPYNVGLNKAVTVTTNGANDPCNYCENSWSDITDGRFDSEPADDGRIKDGVVGWQNNDYGRLMEINVTIDLGQPYLINKIRYTTGNVQRAETWNADSMTTPFGSTPTKPGVNHTGVWTEQNGSMVTSKITVSFQKTRKRWEEDWLYIGDIEVIGTPAGSAGAGIGPSSQMRENGNDWVGNVDPRKCWQDTGLRVEPGQTVQVAAQGPVTWDPTISNFWGTVGPMGSGHPASEIAAFRSENFPVKNANTGSLLMRIGDSDSIYVVGDGMKVRSVNSGNVQFRVNDEWDWLFDNSGRFYVQLRKNYSNDPLTH